MQSRWMSALAKKCLLIQSLTTLVITTTAVLNKSHDRTSFPTVRSVPPASEFQDGVIKLEEEGRSGEDMLGFGGWRGNVEWRKKGNFVNLVLI